MAETGLVSLLPTDLLKEGLAAVRIEVPSWAFLPDRWSFAFMRGLLHLADGFRGKKVWEIGVGTGLNQILLRHSYLGNQTFFSDFDPRCTQLAAGNLARAGLLDERFTPLPGQWDLVTRVDQGEQAPLVDVIVACIPQVPAALDLTVGDNLAHYYDPARYEEAALHAFGLGLNEALLHRAQRVLLPAGRVVLNLAGRPGLSRLLQMFRTCGFTPRVIHEETIPQHAGTSLASLATLEAGEQEGFEFFADASAEVRINARAAEARRVEGLTVFHKIYVIEGELT